jgi:hypothetical protein
MIPPLSKGIPAAVQEPVLSIFLENRLIITGEIPPSDYSDISSLGRRSGGAKPRERHGIKLQAEIGKKHASSPEGRPGGSETCTINVQEESSDYFRRYSGFRLFRYIFIGAPQRRGEAPGASRDKVTGRNRHDTRRHPPKCAPTADQKLVLLCFLEYRLIISGDIQASDYSDISSLGRRSGGAEPRERRLLLLF